MSLLRSENYTMEQLIARRPFYEGNPVTEDILAPTNQLLLGGIQRTATASGRTATVKAGEDIRPALNSLKSAGGGTLVLLAGVHKPLYSIVGDSKINIVGEGIDQTIIDFDSASYSINYIGTSSAHMNSFIVKNLTITASGASGGLRTDYCDNFVFESVKVDSCSISGFLMNRSTSFEIKKCYSSNNGEHGYYITGAGSGNFNILLSTADANTENGFQFSQSGDVPATVFSCLSQNNTEDGFSLGSTASSCIIFSSQSYDNTIYGFYSNDQKNIFFGCTSEGNGTDFYINPAGSQGSLIFGCNRTIQGSISAISEYVFDGNTHARNNLGQSFVTEKEIHYLLNNSGGSLSSGNVVVLDNNANGYYVTTTTTQGDDKVIGVCASAVSNGNNAQFATLGKIVDLKVNGTTAISVGDFLCTFTTAGIAAKAGSGDMAIAIALEAYSTADSNGIIDALIITPRKI